MILSGALAPGERVTEIALAETLGTSRTPVRNALPGLAAEGLLEMVGRRGYTVRAFSDTESWEALRLRGVLEGHAASILAQRGLSHDLLEGLNDCLASGDRLFEKRHLSADDELAYGEMNARFHNLVVENCGSPVLIDLVERLNRLPFVAPSVIVFDQVGLRRAFELLFAAHRTHHAIVDAIRSADAGRAENLFREHTYQQKESMFGRRARAREEARTAPVTS